MSGHVPHGIRKDCKLDSIILLTLRVLAGIETPVECVYVSKGLVTIVFGNSGGKTLK